MKTYTALLIAITIPFAEGQTQSSDHIAELARTLIDEAFPEKRGPHAQVLLLGTFHFKDAGLDNFKPQHQIDVFNPDRQIEIEAIADALAAFKPTKIGIERKPGSAGALQSQYESYMGDDFELPANEIYQLGFRIARKAGHDGVYPVDAPGRWFTDQVDRTEFAKQHGQKDLLRNAYVLSFNRLARRLDALKLEHPLRDHLLLMNDPALLEKEHGIYLPRALGVRDGDDYPGADGFVSQWYNRNLRIVGNIQRIIESEEERIIVIIGAGHVPILRHLVKSAPNMTLVEVSEYL